MGPQKDSDIIVNLNKVLRGEGAKGVGGVATPVHNWAMPQKG